MVPLYTIWWFKIHYTMDKKDSSFTTLHQLEIARAWRKFHNDELTICTAHRILLRDQTEEGEMAVFVTVSENF
jgi:hypothetical protein